MNKAVALLMSVLVISATLAARSTTTAPRASAEPIIDNECVTVWDVTAADPNAPRPSNDAIWVSVSRPGEIAVKSKGGRADAASLGGRAIVIDVKSRRIEPLPNTTGYPLAFPRPGQLKKLLETDRVLVWDFAWTPNVATPMHFHEIGRASCRERV